MTLQERDQLNREMLIEVLKLKDVFYENLNYPFADVKISTNIYIGNLTESVLLESIDTVFRAEFLLYQLLARKAVEIRTNMK